MISCIFYNFCEKLIIKNNKKNTKKKEANDSKQNKTKQNKTKQNKTKQNKTKQNKTKQNKTKQTTNGNLDCQEIGEMGVPIFWNERIKPIHASIILEEGAPIVLVMPRC